MKFDRDEELEAAGSLHDEARKLAAWYYEGIRDAPHDWRCSSEQTGWDRCDCWKAKYI